MGAHTQGYNGKSIGISFIGNFTRTNPNEKQLAAAKCLIDEGINIGKIAPNYRLLGHRQVKATESPGANLYAIIKTWPHWSSNTDI